MKIDLVREIVASLPEGATFRYFRDRYALQLLTYDGVAGRSLSELRRGRFRALARKPAIRAILAACRTRHLGWDLLDSWYPSGTQPYVLTLGQWGHTTSDSWFQTSRPGYNVVVQLNFPANHDRGYRRYVEPEYDPFEFHAHPIRRERPHTMAWSRVDLDLSGREALIEEIQSDWIRDATGAAADALSSLVKGELEQPYAVEGSGCDALQLFRYVEHVLGAHRKLWDEAMLAATLWLLREHLGIRTIYLHTQDGGRALKRIYDAPPRSIYEKLPRRFCFERVERAPEILAQDPDASSRASGHEFWCLEL